MQPSFPAPPARRARAAPLVCRVDDDRGGGVGGEWAPHGAAVVAETQTAGRGRHGRVWRDVPGASLMLSLVLRPALAPERLGLVGLAAGLALAETAGTFGVAARLKWPNDVLAPDADGRLVKLAGVLAEASWFGAAPAVILGAGLNVEQTSFPEDLPATSLRIASGRAVARLDPLAPFLDALAVRLNEAETSPARLLADVEAQLVGLGDSCRVSFPGTDRPALAGTALGLAPDGALRLATDAGEITVHAGEVTLAR